MHSDIFVTPGFHDKPGKVKMCEDSAVQDKNKDGLPLVVLSDGCSSVPDTHIGSALLSKMKANELKIEKFFPSSIIPIDMYNDFIDFSEKIGLKETCLFATISYLFTNKIAPFSEPSVTGFISDDGFIIIKMKNDGNPYYLIYRCHYLMNPPTPYYPVYLLFSDFRKEYKEKFENISACCRVDEYITSDFNEIMYNENYKVKGLIQRDGVRFTINKKIKNIEWIIITSDGLEQFQNKKTGKIVPFMDVIKKLVDFKTYTGEFIKRKMNRILKDYAAEGIYPGDDLSVGGIYYG